LHREIKTLHNKSDDIFVSNIGIKEGVASWDFYLNTTNTWVGILGEELEYSKQFWLYNFTKGLVETHLVSKHSVVAHKSYSIISQQLLFHNTGRNNWLPHA
jgi:hypothetical protein